MKKTFILSPLIAFALICSCQKQDSSAEQELAQRKTELNARENALDERMTALDEKVKELDESVKLLAENQRAMANAGTRAAGVQAEPPDPAQDQAEIERIQQLSAEMRARMTDSAQTNAAKVEKESRMQERLGQQQRVPGHLRSRKLKSEIAGGGAVFPAPEATSPTPSPEDPSPTESPASQ
jgi:hypothetical protein